MDKSKARIQTMFSDIAGGYDLANSVLSLGLHKLWKNQLVSRVKKSNPDLVLDLCCGTGDIHLALIKSNINSIALDFTLPMLKILKSRLTTDSTSAKEQKSTGAVCGDALNLPFNENTFSVVTVSYGVRNFESLTSGLQEIHRVLKPGAKLLILESGQAPKGIIGSLIKFYESKLIPLIGKIFFSNASAYGYLSDSSRVFPSAEQFIEICKAAGFASGSYTVLFFGASYLYEVQK